ncbi:MAG: ATP-binding protein [Pseudomonadota bacterium]
MLLRNLARQIVPKSLFVRTFLIAIIPILLLQIFIGWFFFVRYWDSITENTSRQLGRELAYIISEIRDRPEELPAILERSKASLNLDIVIQQTEILPNQELQPLSKTETIFKEQLGLILQRPLYTDSVSLEKTIIVYIQLADSVMSVLVPDNNLGPANYVLFVMAMVGSSFILIAISTIFLRNQVRPIQRLAKIVDNFGKGRNFEEYVPERGAAEVRQAAVAFNRMSQSVQRQIRQRTDLLSGVSHDLRTPITRMRLQLELMEANEDTDTMRKNLGEMEGMIEGYLTFARGEGTEQSQETNLSHLMMQLAKPWQENTDNIDFHLESHIIASIKPQALRRCIDNLISNALKYAQHVWVSFGIRNDCVEIVVDDDGPGITLDQRENVFMPFTRLDPHIDGTGLGLSIARDIAQAHGGQIFLETAPQGGLRARISLPR